MRQCAIAAFFIFCACAAEAVAQSAGAIQGTVLDPVGAILANVPVQAKNTANGKLSTDTTAGDGRLYAGRFTRGSLRSERDRWRPQSLRSEGRHCRSREGDAARSPAGRHHAAQHAGRRSRWPIAADARKHKPPPGPRRAWRMESPICPAPGGRRAQSIRASRNGCPAR